MRIQLLLSAVCLFLLSSCAQLSTLQTAKTVGKNKGTFGAAAFAYGIQEDGSLFEETGVLPHAEILGRYGISEKFDLGLKLSTGGNALLDGKWQFAGNAASKFAAAIGGGFEMQGSNFQETVVFRTHFPLYLSYHPSEKSGLYASPRFVYQNVSDSENSYFLGGGIGYQHRFSQKFSGVVETSFFSPKTDNASNSGALVSQFGISGIWHFGKK